MSHGEQLPTGTVTFLLTDVEGSTALLERSPDGAYVALQRHHEILAQVVEAAGGFRPAEQGEGDSIVAVFSRAPDALACAAEAQRRLRAERWPDGIDLRVRMALHTGEGILRDAGRYVGLAIHRAARVRGLAHGGQVLVTATTAALTADELPVGVDLIDMGEHRLRDLSRPERVFQLVSEDGDEVFPPLRSLNTVINNLPSQLSTFVGRDTELADISALVRDARLVTLAGAGGAGKTRLAMQVAAEAGAHTAAVWLVELALMPTGAEVVSFVNAQIGGREQPGREPFDVLVDQLGSASTLVVLDNCEHVIDQTARLVADLITRLPGLVIVATSREPLGVPGETVYRVPSMRVPAPDSTPTEIVESDAVRLFIERAQLVRPTFVPTPADLVTLVSICRRLDGLPLPIELAAARLRVMSPAAIEAGLADRFRLLTGGGRTSMARQQTLRASIDWSYGLLGEREKLVLQRLAVYSGGFALEAVEPIAAGGAVDAYEVLDLLSQLIDKSLVQAETAGDTVRYRMLEGIREYALERLADGCEFEEVRDRHLEIMSTLCREAASGLEGSDLPRWVERLELERANFNAAFDWAAHRLRTEALWSMCGALTFFWMSAGHFDEARQWFAECCRHPDVEPDRQLAAKCGAAHLAFYAGRYEDGVELATGALASARAVGNDRFAARAMSSLATIEIFSQPTEAAAALREAADLAGSSGDDWCQCDALQIVGYCHALLDQHELAIEALDAALPIARRLDNAQLLAWDHLGRGWVHGRRGNMALARQCLERGARQADRTGDPNIAGLAISYRTAIELAEGNAAQWQPVVTRALERSVRVGAGTAVPSLAVALLSVAVAVGDLETAEPIYRSYGELIGGLLPVLGPRFFATGARLALLQSNIVEARARAEQSVSFAISVDSRIEAAVGQITLAVADLADGDPAGAESLLHQALPVLADSGCPVDLIDCLGVLAATATARGQAAEAVRIWAAIDAESEQLGLRQLPHASFVSDHRAATTADLGPDERERLVAEGRALSLDDAVTYVRRARGERKRPTVGWDSLTPTENEVVVLVAQGLSNAKIAEKMFISSGTVKTHLSHIYAKLGLVNRTEVTAAFSAR